MKIIGAIPYVAILLANVLYIYIQGLKEEEDVFEVFVFNFVLMVLAGIFIIIKLNFLLHKWIVEEEGK